MKAKNIIEDNTNNKIEKDYIKGKTYKQIAKKHNITENQLQVMIRKNKWKRPSNKSKVKKGNKNAVGNKGNKNASGTKNNKNAVVTGAYEDLFNTVLSKEEQDFLNNYKEQDEERLLLEEIKSLYLREFKMMKRIEVLESKKQELNIMRITKKVGDREGTTTEIESTIEQIQRIENALTGVKEAKRRCIEALDKIRTNKNRLELEILKLEIEQAKESPNNDDEQNKTNSLIEALNDSAKEVWNDEG